MLHFKEPILVPSELICVGYNKGLGRLSEDVLVYFSLSVTFKAGLILDILYGIMDDFLYCSS